MITGRGYGYVAASRFKRRTGVYLFGHLRRTDFLPVGEDQSSEYPNRIWYNTTLLPTFDSFYASDTHVRS